MCNIAFFSARSYDKISFNKLKGEKKVDFHFFECQLTSESVELAKGFEVICCFVNDELSKSVLMTLAQGGTKLIVMRCAGFDRLDLNAAKELGIQVSRVPAYSPEGVAEHAVGLLMCLNRRLHKAYQRTREANFSLDGFIGFNFHGKTAGLIGTGKIGIATARIFKGLGMKVVCVDPIVNPEALALGAEYCTLSQLYEQSDVISLHCPMTKSNRHMINEDAFEQMKDGVMIVNTSRGELLDSKAAIEALKRGKIGALGLDVYEKEKDLFFQDKSNDVIVDDIFRSLSAYHNVLFTGHQAFLTHEALNNIASTTLENIEAFFSGIRSGNELFDYHNVMQEKQLAYS